MSDASPAVPGQSDAEREFWTLFHKHYHAGTGAPEHSGRKRVQKAWTPPELVCAMKRAGSKVDASTIYRWLASDQWPRRTHIRAAADAFFVVPTGHDDLHPDHRTLLELWHTADACRKRGPVAATERAPEPPPPPSPAEWPRSNPRPFLDLAKLELFTPRPADNLGERHNLHGRLQLGPYEPEAEAEQVVIGLREALLAVEVAGGVTIDDSLIGVRAEHENLKAAPPGLIVTGPRNQNRHLEGEVFGEHHIASMAVTEPTQEASITVTLAAGRRGFDVRPIDADGAVLPTPVPSDAKNAVLNRIIEQAIGEDHGGRLILQRQWILHRQRA